MAMKHGVIWILTRRIDMAYLPGGDVDSFATVTGIFWGPTYECICQMLRPQIVEGCIGVLDAPV